MAVTAGHAGSLEDITTTVTGVLGADVVVGLVVAALAVGAAAPAAGLAVWAGRTGPVDVLAGPDPQSGVALHGPDRFVLPASGPVVVRSSTEAQSPLGLWRTGARLRLAGEWSAMALSGVRDIGPPLRVTAASGREVATLDDMSAIERISALARRHVEAPELATIGVRLCLRLPDGPPRRLAGFERTRGALVLVDEPAPEEGSLVHLCVTEADHRLADLTDELHEQVGQGGGGALVVLPDEAVQAGGRRYARPSLPTLVVRAGPVLHASGGSAGTRPGGATVALFPSPTPPPTEG